MTKVRDLPERTPIYREQSNKHTFKKNHLEVFGYVSWNIWRLLFSCGFCLNLKCMSLSLLPSRNYICLLFIFGCVVLYRERNSAVVKKCKLCMNRDKRCIKVFKNNSFLPEKHLPVLIFVQSRVALFLVYSLCCLLPLYYS